MARNDMRGSMRQKAFMFMPFIAIFGVSIIFFAMFLKVQDKQDRIMNKELGEQQFELLQTYQRGEKALLYVDQSARYSIYNSVYDLFENGGSSGSLCGELNGYTLWENADLDCTPDEDSIKEDLALFFGKRMDAYLSVYREEGIPLDNYHYDVSLDPIRIRGIAIKNIEMKVELPDYEKYGYSFPEEELPAEELPSEEQPEEEPKEPTQYYPATSTAAQIDAFFKSRKSPLEGLGNCFVSAESSSGIPSIVMVGVTSHESNYGKSKLAGQSCTQDPGKSGPSYNLFSIKGTSGTAGSCKWETKECLSEKDKATEAIVSCSGTCSNGESDCTVLANFKSYNTQCDAINDFIAFIKHPRYWDGIGSGNPSDLPNCRPVSEAVNDPEELVRRIGYCGYATDPKWAQGVISIMNRYNDEVGSALSITGSVVASAAVVRQCAANCPICVVNSQFVNPNTRAIGIEVVNFGYLCGDSKSYSKSDDGSLLECREIEGQGWEVYPDEQMDALVQLVASLVKTYDIPIDRQHIVGHSEVASGKVDPGPAFDWDNFMKRVNVQVSSSVTKSSEGCDIIPGLEIRCDLRSDHNTESRKIEPSAIVIHYTAGNLKSSYSVLSAQEVSAQYLLDRDGSFVQIVRDDRRANHAGCGVSSESAASSSGQDPIQDPVQDPVQGSITPESSPTIKPESKQVVVTNIIKLGNGVNGIYSIRPSFKAELSYDIIKRFEKYSSDVFQADKIMRECFAEGSLSADDIDIETCGAKAKEEYPSLVSFDEVDGEYHLFFKVVEDAPEDFLIRKPIVSMFAIAPKDDIPPPPVAGVEVSEDKVIRWEESLASDAVSYDIYCSEGEVQSIDEMKRIVSIDGEKVDENPIYSIENCGSAIADENPIDSAKIYYFAVVAVDEAGNYLHHVSPIKWG